MSNMKMFQVGSNLDLEDLTNKLVCSYQMQGFEVSAAQSVSSVSITMKKNMGFFKRILGLAQAITVNLTTNGNGTMVVTFSNKEWGGKVCAIGVGWMIFWVPFFTGIYGVIKQEALPKEILERIEALLVSYGMGV